MFSFLRRKKYRINGRLLVVENRSKLSRKYIEQIKSIIIEIFESEKLLFKFNKLHMVFYDKPRLIDNPNRIKKLMQKNSILEGQAIQPDTIMIDLHDLVYIERKMPFVKYNETLLKDRLKSLVIHEAYHLLHFDRNSAVHLFKRKYLPHVLADLEKSLESIDKPFESTLAESIKRFRTGITNFLGKLWIEGFAEFFEELYNGRLIFDKGNFVRLFSEAELLMKRVEHAFVSFRRAIPREAGNRSEEKMNRCIQAMEKLLNHISVYGNYTIGEHIFFSIRYFDPDMDDEKMMKLHIYKLILLYEKLMLKHGHQPVISLYSGSGIFDYKRAIKFLVVDLKRVIET